MAHFHNVANEQHHHQHNVYEQLSFSSFDELTNNVVSDNSNVNSEWILFDPSSDDDVLSSSYSHAPSNSDAKSSVLSNNNTYPLLPTASSRPNVATVRPSSQRFVYPYRAVPKLDVDQASLTEDDDSLVNALLSSKHTSSKIKLQLPGHDGAGLFQETLLTRAQNSSTSLNDRINEWQQNQARSIFEEEANPLYNKLDAPLHSSEAVESCETDENHHLHSLVGGHTSHPTKSDGKFKKLLNTNRRTSKRFYGDYLLKGLNDKDLNKVKRSAKELSSNLKVDQDNTKSTTRNTMSNKSSLAFNPFLRPLLLSAFMINSRLYDSHESLNNSSSISAHTVNTGDNSDHNDSQIDRPFENFWENDAQSIYSSALSVSSYSSSHWRSDSWAQVI